MKTKKRSSCKGFTLMEMLIVVAIIAILVAISIPVFSNLLGKARSSTCAANHRALKSAIAMEYMSGESSLKVGDYGDADANDKYKQYVCPSDGTISYEIGDGGSITVFCSKHEPGFYDTGGALKKAYEELGGIIKNKSGRIDSNSVDGAFKNQIVEKLPDAATAGTWAVVKSELYGVQYVWTTLDITDIPVSTQVPVICYNSVTHNYTVGTSYVNKHGTYDYKIIAKAAEANGYTPRGSDSLTTSEYAEAVTKYNELLKTYNGK